MVLVLRKKWLAVIAVLAVTMTGGLMYLRYRPVERSVAALSWLLVNRVVVVDAGHGGIDPGTVGPGGTKEKDITLAISLKLREELSRAGAVVVMTRETDTDLSDPGQSVAARKKEDLERRVSFAQEHGGEIYLGIQANSFGTRWTGAQTFYYAGSEEGRKLATSLQDELRRVLGNTNRKSKPLDIFMLRNLSMPAAIIEVGFLSNAGEEELLKNPEYQDKVALAIYGGVIRYLAEENK